MFTHHFLDCSEIGLGDGYKIARGELGGVPEAWIHTQKDTGNITIANGCLLHYST